MAKEDFCFTFYDGDATRDASHMNRLERGAYYDLIIAQRKFGRLTIDQIKKVLGKDFEAVWPALELSLVLDEGFYFIEWVENSLEKTRRHSMHQSDRGKKGGRPRKEKPGEKPEETRMKAEQNPNKSPEKPEGIGDGNGYGIRDEKKGGTGENTSNGIIPDMCMMFTMKNEDYPVDEETDYPALRIIAQKILKWEGGKGDIVIPGNVNTICRRWGELVDFIRADDHYSGYSLSRVNKHLQSIIQSFNSQKDGRHTTATVGKTFIPD